MRCKKSPRVFLIRGFFRRNHVLQMKSICQTQCCSIIIVLARKSHESKLFVGFFYNEDNLVKKSNLIGDTVTSSGMILLFNYPKMIFLLSLELKSRTFYKCCLGSSVGGKAT